MLVLTNCTLEDLDPSVGRPTGSSKTICFFPCTPRDMFAIFETKMLSAGGRVRLQPGTQEVSACVAGSSLSLEFLFTFFKLMIG